MPVAIDSGIGEGGGFKPEPELKRLSKILKTFNDSFGTLFTDSDRVVKKIREEVAPRVQACGLPKRQAEHAPHRPHGARSGVGHGDANSVLISNQPQPVIAGPL